MVVRADPEEAWLTLKRGIRRTYRALAVTLGRLYQDDGWAMASHLALSALMALFPFLIFVAAVAGVIGEEALADQVADLLFQAIPAEIAGPIAREVHNVLTGPQTSVLTISVVVTIYLASNGVEAVRAALSRAYGARQDRGFLYLRLQSIVFVLIGAVAALVSATLGVLGPTIWGYLEEWLPGLTDFRFSFNVGRILVVGILLAAALTAAHRWLPGRPKQRMRLWPGILATMILWWIATEVFAAYLIRFANYATTYAGLASVVTVIFYLYIMSLILIFGAELNAAIVRTRPPDAPPLRQE